MKKLFLLFMLLTLTILTSIFFTINIYAVNDEELTWVENETNVVYDNVNEASSRSIEGGSEINGEIWYGIDLNDNGSPIITYNIDYSSSNLLKYVKPGDIVYEQNAGLDIVDYVGHIALVVDVVQDTPTQQGYILLVESMPNVANPYTGEARDLGVCYALMTPTRFTEKYVTIMRVHNATEEQIQGAIQFAKDQANDDDIWLFRPWKETDMDHDIWYCSELVWAAYYHQGVFLEPHDNTPVFPSEVYASSAVSTILRYNSPTTFSEVTATHHTYSCDGDTYTEAHDCVYESIDNQTHSVSCFCEYISTEPHNYETYNVCYEKCSDCGYIRQAQAHDYTYEYIPNGEEMHYASCECGAKIKTEHEFTTTSGGLDMCYLCFLSKAHIHSYTYVPAVLGRSHRKICHCGISESEMCFGSTAPGLTSNCLKCGQVLNGGLITPFSDDDDENDVMIYKKDDTEEETE